MAFTDQYIINIPLTTKHLVFGYIRESIALYPPDIIPAEIPAICLCYYFEKCGDFISNSTLDAMNDPDLCENQDAAQMTKFVDQYLHSMHDHRGDKDCDILIAKCSVSECQSFVRNKRRRQKFTQWYFILKPPLNHS